MPGEELVPVRRREVILDLTHQTRTETAPPQPGMDDKPPYMARPVFHVSSHRTYHFILEASSEDETFIVFAEEVGERLGQRWDLVVVVEFSFGLVAEELQPEYFLRVTSAGRSDLYFHALDNTMRFSSTTICEKLT